jgi:hypothetical protein
MNIPGFDSVFSAKRRMYLSIKFQTRKPVMNDLTVLPKAAKMSVVPNYVPSFYSYLLLLARPNCGRDNREILIRFSANTSYF